MTVHTTSVHTDSVLFHRPHCLALLDKENEVTKCKLCEAKNDIKVLKVEGYNTKSLHDHIEMIHKFKQKNINPKGQIDIYFGQKSLGETIAKLVIDGLTF